MKTSKKTLQVSFLLILTMCFNCKAQTNVSGGIYTTTTWTKANSPYIVVDTVVVFPNVTLTIEPGTVVKFADSKYIEIRNSTLIANGSAVDSITFTSNSLTPAAGIWGRILLNNATATTSFNFVNIKYAHDGIIEASSISYIKNSTFSYNVYGLDYVSGTPIDSCNFKYNGTGINSLSTSHLNFCTLSNNTTAVEDPFSGATLSNCTIDSNQTGVDMSDASFLNCTINYNQTGLVGNGNNILISCIIDYNSTKGLDLQGLSTDSVANCEIKFNGIGITAVTCADIGSPSAVTQCVIENNNIGIQVGGCDNIYCNRICNNTSYDLQNLTSRPFSLPNNNWCTSDSATIETYIYDGYDNVSLGLVSFMPLDSTCAPVTAIKEVKGNESTAIYPNPVYDYLIIELTQNIVRADIRIFNLLGELTYSSITTKRSSSIDVSNLPKGLYIIEIINGNKIERQKFLKQ